MRESAHLANPVGVADWNTTQFRTLLATLVDRETLMFSMRNGDSTAKRLNDVSRNQKPKSGSFDSNRQW